MKKFVTFEGIVMEKTADMILLKNVLIGGKSCDMVINDGRIVRICDAGTVCCDGADVMECNGKVAMPGFVNMHTHAGMSMMRGVGEDIAFHEWLDRIWEIEKNIDPEYVYHATKVACLEMIKTGTTTFNDQYWHLPMACKAADQMGLRAALSYVICDRHNPKEAERQKAECISSYEESKSWSDRTLFVRMMSICCRTASFHQLQVLLQMLLRAPLRFLRHRIFRAFLWRDCSFRIRMPLPV
jgi:5-methylthioadenosine/S-adenosylhomocysteine deaminase